MHSHPQEFIPALLTEILELRLQPESSLRRILPDIIDGVLQVSLEIVLVRRRALCNAPRSIWSCSKHSHVPDASFTLEYRPRQGQSHLLP